MELPLEPQAKLRRLDPEGPPVMHQAYGEINLVEGGKTVKFHLGIQMSNNNFLLHRDGGGYWSVSIEELIHQACLAILVVEGM